MDLSRPNWIWSLLRIAVIPVLMGMALGWVSLTGRKQTEALLDRMPVEAVEVLRARISLALMFGLPLWLIVSFILTLGLPAKLILPWALAATGVFSATLVAVTSLIGAFTKRSQDPEHVINLWTYGLFSLFGLLRLVEAQWPSPNLLEGVVMVFCCVSAAISWRWAKQVAQVSALGLNAAQSGRFWWWPRYSALIAYVHIEALWGGKSLLLVLWLSIAVAWSGSNLRSQWILREIHRSCGPGTTFDYRPAALYLGWGLLSVGLGLYRFIEFCTSYSPIRGELGEDLQRAQSLGAPFWILFAAIVLSVLATIYMIQKTKELLDSFRRRDLLVLRLPMGRGKILQARRRQWSRQMALPMGSVSALNLFILLFNFSAENSQAWIGQLVVVQVVVALIGSALVFVLVAPKSKKAKSKAS